MIASEINEQSPSRVFYLMSEQPDCCPQCQTRLDLVEVVTIDDEILFVNFCATCQREILIVEG